MWCVDFELFTVNFGLLTKPTNFIFHGLDSYMDHKNMNRNLIDDVKK